MGMSTESFYNAGKAFLKSEVVESLAKERAVAASEEEFLADFVDAMKQNTWAAATLLTKTKIKKPLPPMSKRAARDVEKVFSTESLKKELTDQDQQELNGKAQQFIKRSRLMEGKEKFLTQMFEELAQLGEEASPEQILDNVNKYFGAGEEAEADYAFGFLLETTSGKLRETIGAVRRQFNEKYSKEIKKGQTIEKLAIDAQEELGGGKISEFYDLFTHVLSTEGDSIALYKEFKMQFTTPEERKKIIAALYHSIGVEVRTLSASEKMQLKGKDKRGQGQQEKEEEEEQEEGEKQKAASKEKSPESNAA